MSQYKPQPLDSFGGYYHRRDPDRPRNLVVIADGSHVPCVLLSESLTRMHDAGLSPTTVNAYARGALAFFSHRRRMLGSTTVQSLLPWSSPHDLRMAFRDFLVSLNATAEPSTTETDVWHVKVNEERASEVIQSVCGVFHAFESLVHAGVLPANPFEVPMADRRARRLPGLHNMKLAPLITPRFRFRIPASAASALRTDSGKHIALIVPALIAFGVPVSIVIMIKTMIEGLARISEQCRITVWDYWDASRFGDAIDTTNKGDGDARVKVQVFSLEHAGEVLIFFDGLRRAMDPDGWGLEEWRDYLTDETVPLRIRKAKAMASPLFPKQNGGFYTKAGVVDRWYRPAMKAAGLPTRTHYMRHAGVNAFLAWIAQQEMSEEQKDAARLEFARGMGWKWPEVMLARYSLPERRHAAFEVRRSWLAARVENEKALADGYGRPPAEVIPMSTADRSMSRLVKFRCSEERKAA